MSQKTGTAPAWRTAIAVATKLKAGTITSSPGPTPSGNAHLADHLEPILAPAERLFNWLSDGDCELLERFLDSLAALKDHAAAATPGPEPEHSSEPYSPALLM